MITSIKLNNFRSYTEARFEFSDKTNIVVGPNGSGKTNLLEAILVSLKGKSYRAKDADLIEFKKPWATINTELSSGSTRKIKLTAEPASKTYEIDGKSFKQLNTTRTVPVILFEPNHLQLLLGNPTNRRDYLDDLVEQVTPGYKKLRQQYLRTLAQRNNLLKSVRSYDESLLFPWNVRLSELAGPIARGRQKLIKQINQDLSNTYESLSDSATAKVELVYESEINPDNYETRLIKTLEQNLSRDLMRGHTSYGPHRDDFTAQFNGVNAPDVASRGEMRTLILALKFAEIGIYEELHTTNPVILLDDVFSELDIKRRKKLLNRVKKYQSFITTTDIDNLDKKLRESSKTITFK